MMTYNDFCTALVPGGPTLGDVCGDELNDVAEKDRIEFLAEFRTLEFMLTYTSNGNQQEDSESFTGQTHAEVYEKLETYALELAARCEATVEIYSHGMLEGDAYYDEVTREARMWWKR